MTIKHGNIENKQHRTVLGNINELTRAQRPKANQRWRWVQFGQLSIICHVRRPLSLHQPVPQEGWQHRAASRQGAQQGVPKTNLMEHLTDI